MMGGPSPRVSRRSVVVAVALSLWLVATAPATQALGADAATFEPRSPPDDALTSSEATVPDDRSFSSPAVTLPTRGPDTAVNASYTYRRLPDRPGVVGVTIRLPATPSVDRVSVGFRDEVRVVETTNVTRTESGYDWAGERPATVAYRVPINWTYVGNRDEAWTLVEHRTPSVDAAPSVDFRERLSVAGQGYVGETTVLLGAHDVYERRAAGQQVRVVVPAGVELNTGAERTVETLASAARSLSIGGRDTVVHGFVTPQIETEATRLEQPGFALDDRTLLVDADYEIDTWTHEYVHTRQALPDSGELRWLTEGSAEYYGWLLSIEQGADDWGSLRGAFSRGIGDDSVLADPDTWRGETDYNKGALVLGVLDREIRWASDGERTVADALRRVNEAEDPTLETFIEAVHEAGGADAAAAARKYTTTGAAPNYQPDSPVLDAVYGLSPNGEPDPSPDIRTQVRTLSATGPNASRTIDPAVQTVTVRQGETLRVEAQVTNGGDAGGLASLAVRRSPAGGDTGRVATPWVGWVPPGETVTRTGTHEFGRPGTYELSWGDRQYTVRVAPDRETASVTGVAATRNDTDGRVVVRATVRNDGPRPTFAELPVSVAGQRVATQAIVLDGTTTRTVTVRLNVSKTAPFDVSVADARTAVQEEAPDGPARTPPDALLLSVAVLAVLVIVALVVRRLGVTGEE